MAKYKKVIFVCTDNTCLSIMAEAVMNSVNKKRLVEVASRGLVVLFPEPVNPKAVAILKSYQQKAAKESSEPLSPEDLTEDTLILTMTENECRQARDFLGTKDSIETIGDFVGKPGDIEEPHGGTLAEYGACYEYIDFMVKVAAEIIFRGE